MLLILLLLAFILASFTPPVALAVALLSWCGAHIFLTILLVIFFA